MTNQNVKIVVIGRTEVVGDSGEVTDGPFKSDGAGEHGPKGQEKKRSQDPELVRRSLPQQATSGALSPHHRRVVFLHGSGRSGSGLRIQYYLRIVLMNAFRERGRDGDETQEEREMKWVGVRRLVLVWECSVCS